MTFHSKAWTASVMQFLVNKPLRLTAQLETGKQEGLLDRLKKDDPIWELGNTRLYRSRPFHKSFFRNGLAIKCTEIKFR